MSDIFSRLEHLSPGPLRDEIMTLVRTVGLRKALLAAFDLLENPKTPAAARATMVNAIFKLNGLDRADDEDEDPFGIGRMSPEQIAGALPLFEKELEWTQAWIEESKARLKNAIIVDDEDDVDVFA